MFDPYPGCPFGRKGQSMKQNKGYKRRAYRKPIDGEWHYYAVYEGKSLDVSKPVYGCVKKTYQDEDDQERSARKHCVSADQLKENILQMDQHGTTPSCFQTCSAEDDGIEHMEHEDIRIIFDLMWKEIDLLSDEDRELLLTFRSRNGEIGKVADKYGIPERTAYYRRNLLAKRIREHLIGDDLLYHSEGTDPLSKRRALLREIASLSRDEQRILLCARNGADSMRQLADELGFTVRTLYRRRAKLKNRMGRNRWDRNRKTGQY